MISSDDSSKADQHHFPSLCLGRTRQSQRLLIIHVITLAVKLVAPSTFGTWLVEQGAQIHERVPLIGLRQIQWHWIGQALSSGHQSDVGSQGSSQKA